jgi:cell division protein FtsA
MIDSYICVLDVGSSKIAACVARLKRKRIVDIFCESIAVKGIRKGVIVDSVDLTDAIAEVVKKLKDISRINIRMIHANISGRHLITKHSHAVIPLTERGNKIITLGDIKKVNEQALLLGSHIDEEIIHYFPSKYTIDANETVVNPIGLYSHRLEVDLFLVCGKLAQIQTVTHVVNQAGFDIKTLFFSGLANAHIVFGTEPAKGINVICDIGSDVTELVFFRDGLLKTIVVLPAGGDELTQSLVDAFPIPRHLAEDIKLSYGVIGDSTQVRDDKEVLIKKDNSYQPVKQRVICQTITAAARNLCRQIKTAVEQEVNIADINKFVVAGRGIFHDGLLELLESVIGLKIAPARVGNSEILPFLQKLDLLSGQKYITFLTALGLISYQMNELQPPKDPSLTKVPNQPFLKVIHKVKEVWQEYF